jgi:hypothetical protein
MVYHAVDELGAWVRRGLPAEHGGEACVPAHGLKVCPQPRGIAQSCVWDGLETLFALALVEMRADVLEHCEADVLEFDGGGSNALEYDVYGVLEVICACAGEGSALLLEDGWIQKRNR